MHLIKTIGTFCLKGFLKLLRFFWSKIQNIRFSFQGLQTVFASQAALQLTLSRARLRY